MSTIQAKIQAVRAAVVKRPPYCSGVVDVDDTNSRLFYKRQDDTAGFLKLTSAPPIQLQDLTDACSPATFGRDKQDVYDESYRKARKLDEVDFATKFDPHVAGIIKDMREGLLEGLNQKKPIKVELYKLNVYDQGSFFKAHKDTPRSGSMFGSLVVVFPTAHQGGNLLLRHDGEEWSFDSAEVLSKSTSPKAAYIAFFSDVEHEVTPVESGYRVTLTYNLSYEEDLTGDTGATPQTDPSSLIFKSIPDIIPLQAAITSLLQDTHCLPQGGFLGFGLRFSYPAFGEKSSESDLQLVLNQLKGSDSLLKQVCDTLSLSTTLEVVFDESSYGFQVLVPKAVDLSDMEVEFTWDYELDHHGAKKVVCWDVDNDMYPDAPKIMWLTPKTEFRTYESQFVAHGNESSVGHAYGDICLVAKIGPIDQRETAL